MQHSLLLERSPLDSPGHAIGHLSGLVRTSTNPDTFLFMAGDTCHHGGEFRPSEFLSLPAEITAHPLMGHRSPFPYPSAMFEDLQRESSRSPQQAFFSPSTGFDVGEANRSVHKLQEVDASSSFWVVMAHDDTLHGVVDFFPKGASDWRKKGWGGRTRWAFLKDFASAINKKA